MVPVMSLWAPILLSAVVVFVASSVIHMVLRYHRGDFGKIAAEDEVIETLRRLHVRTGEYMVPCSPGNMKDPAFVEKMKKGPVAILNVMADGAPSMGASLAQWFVYCVVASLFAAYVAGRALAPGAPYLAVFRFAGCTAFVGYSLALWQSTIWYKRRLSTTVKLTIDGLVYGLLTAGVFGWLWPR
jgi:hypothetical protein